MITPEDITVARELFVEDVYHAATIFDSTDRWLDVGCHAGYFSLLALMHGASVAGGVDADKARFADYQYGQRYMARVVNGAQLGMFIDTTAANAVKLDIQGGERFVIGSSGEECLKKINKIVVEWHYTESIINLLDELDNYGFKIIYCDAATDILTNESTYIVYARRA